MRYKANIERYECGERENMNNFLLYYKRWERERK